MVLDDSHGVSRVPRYSGSRPASLSFAYRGLTSYAGPSHGLRLLIFRFPPVPQPLPRRAGLGSSPFARRYSGNRFYFLFLQLLGCFGSLGCPPYSMDSNTDMQILFCMGFPIRISPDRCLLATPRSFSQLAASFIGSWRLGIRRMPFLT